MVVDEAGEVQERALVLERRRDLVSLRVEQLDSAELLPIL